MTASPLAAGEQAGTRSPGRPPRPPPYVSPPRAQRREPPPGFEGFEGQANPSGRGFDALMRDAYMRDAHDIMARQVRHAKGSQPFRLCGCLT